MRSTRLAALFRVVLTLALSLAVTGVAPTVRADDRPASDTSDAPATPTTASAAVTVPAYPNPTCPVMGKPASAELFVDVEQGRIYVCCAPCVKKVKRDAARAYQAAYPTVKPAGNAVCPISGKAVLKDAPTVTIQGVSIALCEKDHTARAKATPQLALAKAMDGTLSDVANPVCPVTGEPVTNDVFCVIERAIVHLSSAAVLDTVRADSAKALATARESAAQAAKEQAERTRDVKPTPSTDGPAPGSDPAK